MRPLWLWLWCMVEREGAGWPRVSKGEEKVMADEVREVGKSCRPCLFGKDSGFYLG